MNRQSAKSGLGWLAIAAALVVAGCGGSGPTPQVIYIPLGSSPSPSLTHVSPTAMPTPTDTEVPTPTGTDASTPTAPPQSTPGSPSIASVKVTDGGSSAPCGNWTVEFAKPVVSGVPTADTINAAITAKVAAFITDFKSQMASGGGAGPCSLKGGYQEGISSSALIGISFSEEIYLGGASTGTVAGSINFIVSNGATVALTDLLTTPAAGAAALSTQSRALLPAALIGDVDATAINAGTMPVMANFEKAWAFTSAGLKLTFQELQVASAVSGTPSVVIPWASLKNVINPSGPAGPFVA
ncbi:MAG TPA: hypothetical protein VJ258_00145 [Candidatus Limnocylindrales bacterium]|jgi:Protein of unknown function (DUF3298).|nr:hypothetical protein [Candidatus Limnocylindrales bacterium]